MNTGSRLSVLGLACVLLSGCVAGSLAHRASQRPQSANVKLVNTSRVDLVSARYPITKLPEFAAPTQDYRLLAFGRASKKPKVWFIVDGEDIYCDLNGNGDLTDPGEKQKFVEAKELKFANDDIEVLYNGNVLKARYKGILQGSTYPSSTTDPQDAPIFHIDGPLKAIKHEFRDRSQTPLADYLIYMSLGTQYEGVEVTEVRYESIPDTIVPTISLAYAHHPTIFRELPKRC